MIKKILPVSLIIGLRFFGLFLILSIIANYAKSLEGSSGFLAGVALGGYALTQAIFQVPFGSLSDKWGRKKAIILGLLIFLIGSIICAFSNNIYILLIGRFLQGAGAIGSVVSAMVADYVREDERAHAMAIMGVVIALSFASAFVFGPILAGIMSEKVLFLFVAFLSLIAILIAVFLKEPPKITHSYSQEESKFIHVIKDKDLVKMYITFLFHSSTMAIAFFIIPILLKEEFGFKVIEFWKIYLPAVIFGILAMGPAAVFGEKYGRGKEVFLVSIVFILIAFALIVFSNSIIPFGIGVALFFIGFNMFEPLLQSFVSKFAKVHQKGAALGFANTLAYIGIFAGGGIAGSIYDKFGKDGIFWLILVIAISWIYWVVTMKNPGLRRHLFIEVRSGYNLDKLKVIEGVLDFYINENERILVIKYDASIISEEELKRVI